MTIATVRAALQDIHLTITGVKTAPDDVPWSLNSADLPAVIVYDGPGEWTQTVFGTAGDMDVRTYYAACFVAPVTEGIPGETYTLAETLLQRFAAKYRTERQISSSVVYTWTLKDSGVTNGLTLAHLKLAGVEYLGFVFTLIPWEQQ